MAGIDVHQHLWPPSFVEALSVRKAPPLLEPGRMVLAEGAYPFDPSEHALESRLTLLDRAGLDRAVVSLQPTLGLERLDPAERDELESTWEEGVLAVARESGGRIVPLSPRLPRPGFAGASVGADAFDDLDRLVPVLEALRASGFLFVHPVAAAPPPGAPAWWAPVADYTGQMQRAFLAWLAGGGERWPEVRIVFAILAGGAPIQVERLGSRGIDVSFARRENVFFDTASYGPRALRLAIETVGAGQLLFGTDVPVVDPDHAATALAALGPELEHTVRVATPGGLLD